MLDDFAFSLYTQQETELLYTISCDYVESAAGRLVLHFSRPDCWRRYHGSACVWSGEAHRHLWPFVPQGRNIEKSNLGSSCLTAASVGVVIMLVPLGNYHDPAGGNNMTPENRRII